MCMSNEIGELNTLLSSNILYKTIYETLAPMFVIDLTALMYNISLDINNSHFLSLNN